MLDIELTSVDIDEIKNAQRALQPIPGDCGDEYRKPPFLTATGDLSHHISAFPKVYEPIAIDDTRAQIFSGTVWEQFAGYCRAVKDGNRIHISGTTATHGSKMIGGSDPAAQTHFVIDKIEAVLESFGGSLNDIVRTRIFVNDLDDWEAVARAHGDRFNGINPANTLVQARLVGDGYLVEIEAEAVLKPT
jgi:enamine deaminase RidA (YjgF/YER057c/UK114 family)